MDSARNYSASIDVAASPAACFDAVATGMSRWWTETVEGRLDKVGDSVTAIFPPDFGHWTFEAEILERNSLIRMVCTDAHHSVEGQPEAIDREWLGTHVVWEFTPQGDGTRIRLSHIGLTPRLNCWDICVDGWNFFFKDSLKAYLDGGPARPHRAPETPAQFSPSG